MKKEIKNKDDLSNYCEKFFIKIMDEINKNNTIAGTKFELFCFDDYKMKFEFETDFNMLVFDTLFNYVGLMPENFMLLSSRDKIFDFFEFALKKDCLDFLKKRGGDIVFNRNDLDFKVNFSTIYERNFLNIGFVLKIILLKYN